MQQNSFNHCRLLRLWDVLSIVPVSRSAWLNGVRDGRFPAPIALGPRTVAWRYSDVARVCEEGLNDEC